MLTFGQRLMSGHECCTSAIRLHVLYSLILNYEILNYEKIFILRVAAKELMDKRVIEGKEEGNDICMWMENGWCDKKIRIRSKKNDWLS